MILERYIAGQILRAWLAVSAVLLLVLFSSALAELLVGVTDGSVPRSALWSAMSEKMLGLWVNLTPMSIALGIVLALGRLYRDSEMAAAMACGLSGWRLYRASLWVVVPMFLLTLGLSLEGVPAAARADHQARQQLTISDAVAGLQPGQFSQFRSGAVVYTGPSSNDERLDDVFFYAPSAEGFTLESAPHAEYFSDQTQLYLVLQAGRLLDDRGEYPLQTDYAQHGIAVAARESDSSTWTRQQHAMATLWAGGRDDHIELMWRVVVALSALAMALLAVPLAHMPPRRQPYGRMLVAVIAYLILANTLVAARQWASGGAPLLGMALPLLAFGLGALELARRRYARGA